MTLDLLLVVILIVIGYMIVTEIVKLAYLKKLIKPEIEFGKLSLYSKPPIASPIRSIVDAGISPIIPRKYQRDISEGIRKIGKGNKKESNKKQ